MSRFSKTPIPAEPDRPFSECETELERLVWKASEARVIVNMWATTLGYLVTQAFVDAAEYEREAYTGRFWGLVYRIRELEQEAKL